MKLLTWVCALADRATVAMMELARCKGKNVSQDKGGQAKRERQLEN